LQGVGDGLAEKVTALDQGDLLAVVEDTAGGGVERGGLEKAGEGEGAFEDEALKGRLGNELRGKRWGWKGIAGRDCGLNRCLRGARFDGHGRLPPLGGGAVLSRNTRACQNPLAHPTADTAGESDFSEDGAGTVV
jgi:hypothetical protein